MIAFSTAAAVRLRYSPDVTPCPTVATLHINLPAVQYLGGPPRMSAHGNFNFASDLPAFDPSAATLVHARQPRTRRCDFCHEGLDRQPPVLLKSGHRVHLGCYLLLRKKDTSS